MKRGQITSFIIVGIVIIFVLAFAVYISYLLGAKPPKIDVPPEKGNLRVCLEQASRLSLVQVGLQGGTASAVSHGFVLTPAENVSINIISGNPVAVNAPAFAKWYGLLKFQPLCLRQGTNRPNASLNNENDCLAGTYQIDQPDTDVLQAELERLITVKASACGVSGPITVTFGANDVTVQSTNVSAIIPIRFKRVYNAAFMLARKDATDATFDKRNPTTVLGCIEPANNNNCLLAGMAVNMTQAPGASIVEIVDTAKPVPVTNQPFIFRFAVANRAPAIVSVAPSLPPMDPQVWQLAPGVPIDITITSADPDEYDVLTITCTKPNWITCTTTQTNDFTVQTVVHIDPPCDPNGVGPSIFSYSVKDQSGSVNGMVFNIQVSGSDCQNNPPQNQHNENT